ncbi:precorrin-2 dehydrogenase/sirohydrochlorin ferrochelatase family protein [Paenibacillus lemnae]|uniref:precorrin-2 dehydrogenase n=1 Tax=Paenibacillus lemnae TaxID=1330551 RepID=A0A848M6S4_PAELE|nr:bifunctional precorrin-2 dehydrogenase/sirohydrochlorin ferrochelatase [Paenibacillus lemnae]NMO95294.1 bifunctional precorrin-2 dehydrogenase/sirohydrochlorin ferrochelatase [Paenibacillus lemnae]
MVRYVPVMLNCEGQRCIIFGGGSVAERKAGSLHQAGASVHIISPQLTPGLSAMAASGDVAWTSRLYREGDLQGAFLVYAATGQEDINEEIASEARRLGIMVNVAHRGESGDFISPAVLRRGRLTLAVSTADAGPLASLHVCRRLSEEFGETFDAYLEFMSQMRTIIKDKIETPSTRHRLLRKLYEQDFLRDMEQGVFTPWSMDQIDEWITYNQED